MSEHADELIFANADLVLPRAVVRGSLRVQAGVIQAVEPGTARDGAAIDLDGDYLMPGAVDLHTDNLERQVEPRTKARWPSRSAMLAHDGQCAVAGVTTVLDALCLGDVGFGESRMQTAREGVADLDALAGTGLLKCDHYLHLRCELPAGDMLAMFDQLVDHRLVRLVSLMDHSPGVGQYADLNHYRAVRRRHGTPEAIIEQRISDIAEKRDRLRDPNRRAVLARMAHRGVALASHDDRN